ncbi:MAG: radical SAM protein [Nanoarchaeota archaeon]
MRHTDKKPKTALIIPPSPFLADERVFPFLGILKVASVLESRGYPVDVLDLSGIRNYLDVIDAYMGENNANNFGITATTPQFPRAVDIARRIKINSPGVKTIFGGAHATMVGSAYGLDVRKNVVGRGTTAYRQMVELFDKVVIGDGEEAIFEALKEGSEKVIDAGSLKSPFFLQRGTLDKYPVPSRHLIDFDSYHYKIDGKDAQSMIAQLGCPFECGFCGGRNTNSFRVTRTRSIESIMEEVDLLVNKYGKRGIMFYDDELNLSNATLMNLMGELVKYQEKNSLELRLRGFVKAELFTPEQANLMYRAGFRVMLSGVESGDDGMLFTMNKKTTREINSAWVRYCHEAGLKAKALMSIGHPGETEETINNSLEWVLTNRPDDVDFTIITQYPGSPYFDSSVRDPSREEVWVYTEPRTKKVLFSQDVNFAEKAEYYKGVPGDYTSFVWTESLSAQDLVRHRDRAEKTSREALGLEQIAYSPGTQFEHSMGQGLPSSILRSS